MPSIKRTGIKAKEQKTGFEPYDGPEPTKRGMYRGYIKQLKYKIFNTGATGFKMLVELEAAKGDPKGHAKFDGYPSWSNLVFGEKEAQIVREGNFYAALGLKDDPTIVTAESISDKGEETEVKSIGGKKVEQIGKIAINVDLKRRSDGQDGMEVDGIYPVREIAASKASDEDDDEDEENEDDLLEDGEEPEDEEEDTEDGEDYEDREAELKKASLADLKEIASEYDIEIKGLKKSDLVDAILEAEYGDEEDEDEEADDEDDEELEDELDDEEDDEDEEDEERAERMEELGNLNRLQLRRELKKADPDAQVKKSHTDDEIREMIIDAEFGSDEETPF